MKNFYKILITVCVVIASVCGFHLWTVYVDEQIRLEALANVKKDVIEEEKGNEFTVDWASLQQQNPEIVGWIYVPFCNISYPVVQSQDNQYYLNHSFNGGYDEFGTIFLDSMAHSDFSSDNSILYGHSSYVGQMFSGLSNYRDETFFNDHPYFYLLTPDRNYRVNISMFVQTTYMIDFYNVVFGENRDAIVEDLKTRATYINEDTDISEGNFISLSTCNLDYGLDSDQRLLLTGIAEEIDTVEYEG